MIAAKAVFDLVHGDALHWIVHRVHCQQTQQLCLQRGLQTEQCVLH